MAARDRSRSRSPSPEPRWMRYFRHLFRRLEQVAERVEALENRLDRFNQELDEQRRYMELSNEAITLLSRMCEQTAERVRPAVVRPAGVAMPHLRAAAPPPAPAPGAGAAMPRPGPLPIADAPAGGVLTPAHAQPRGDRPGA